MASHITDTLFLGDIDDAMSFDGEIISCLQDLPRGVPKRALWIPVIRTSSTLNDYQLIKEQDVDVIALTQQLDLVAREIEERMQAKKRTLVHCLGGMERSPLAVVWWLHKYRNMGLNDAYKLVKEKRPVVMDRLEWLNISYDERLS